MKQFLFFPVLALMLTVQTANAFPVKKSSIRSKLRKEITAQVGFPEAMAFDQNENVPVRFKTDHSLNLQLLEVKTGNEDLRKYIQREFSKMKVNKAHLFPDTEYRVSVTIKDLR